MQFWKSSPKKIARNAGTIRSTSQNYWKNNNFSSENFCSENFFNMYKAVLTTPFENFREKPTRFCSMSEDDRYFCFYKQPIFSSLLSNGHVRSRFHSPAGKSPTEKVWLKIPKNEKRFNSMNFVFWKRFCGYVQCSIDNTVEKVSINNRHAPAPCL